MPAPAHIFKTARRQMRKIRRRGAHTATEKRLLASADQQRQEGLGWRYDGFRDFSTQDLLLALSRIAIVLDEQGFRDEALAAGTPTRLSEDWDRRSSAAGKWKDLPNLAARELWRRLLPSVKTPEVIADQVDELLEDAEVAPDRAPLWSRAAQLLVKACVADGKGNRSLFAAVVRESGSDLSGWMVEMPALLLGTPHAQEAPDLCDAFATLLDAKSLLAQRAELLGNLGRGDEALAQIESLLGKHPDDPVVLLKAGATFEALGMARKAGEHFRRYAEAMQNPRSAPAIAAAGKLGMPLPPREGNPAAPVIPQPEETCPCGSGRKWKRCHGVPS
jgi:tetratricopeptide (TPR) repeat protein